eukprot:4433006-Lingulodinium_polyedra.AAC.1
MAADDANGLAQGVAMMRAVGTPRQTRGPCLSQIAGWHASDLNQIAMAMPTISVKLPWPCQ